MIVVFLLLILVPTLFIVLFSRKSKKSLGKRHPPSPPGLPIIGNLHQLDSSAPHKYFLQLSKKYGPIISLRLGSRPVLVVSSARMAEEVMRNNDLIFCSRPTMLGQRKLSYNGLDIALSPYNEEWREMRKICVVHLLSTKRVQLFRSIREDEVSRMIKKISKESQITNLSETLVSLTSTMICRIGFGKRYDEEGSERRRFYHLVHEAQAMFVGFFVSDYFPSIGWMDKFIGNLSRLDRIFNQMDSFYDELIDEHLDSNRPKSMDGDIIDLMLQLQQDKSTLVDITKDRIKAMLMDVFFAGTDTSAATIVWAMTALIKNPVVMKKVKIEIKEVIGNKQFIDEDDSQKLSYLKAVVKESLRLFPPAPLLVPRETLQDCTIDGYEIPRKTDVFVNAWAIARDPEYWENPEEFMPERFMDGKVDLQGQHFQLIPFGAGRRSCPGMSLGLATVELALANLLNSFDWELPFGVRKEDIDTDVLPGLTMHKKNALCLVAKYCE